MLRVPVRCPFCKWVTDTYTEPRRPGGKNRQIKVYVQCLGCETGLVAYTSLAVAELNAAHDVPTTGVYDRDGGNRRA